MPNVTFVNIVSSSGGTGNFIASVVSTNLNNIATVVNSGGLDGANYGLSSDGKAFVSSNFSQSQVLSQHLSGVVGQRVKIMNEGAIQDNVQFASTDDGAPMWQWGGTNMPANGVAMGRYSGTFSFAATGATTNTASIQVIFTGGIDGDPAFTTTPTPIGVPAYAPFPGAGVNAKTPREIWITALDSVSADFILSRYLPASFANTAVTWNVQFIGPV